MDEQQHRDDPVSGFGSLRHRLRYRFDNLLARGTSAALVWLGLVTFAAILLSSVVLALFQVSFDGSGDEGWLEDFWQSMLRVMDPGTMAGDVGWGRRILALAVTVFGLLVAGTLIGIIAAGVEERIDVMRRGRSVVIETDHIVVLGNSTRIPVLVDQLTLANERNGGRTIVVLTEGDPADMLSDVAEVVDDTRGSRLVYRSGDSTRRSDLELVRLHAARSVIVLAGDGGDVRAVKTVLAIGAELGGFDRVPVVVEMSDPDAAVDLQRACGDLVHPILPVQASARTAVFAMGGPGLGRVIDELLDFRSCDLHIRDDVDVTGSAFADLVARYTNARPIGRLRADGEVDLNPEPDTVFAPGDRLVVFADDRGPLIVSTTSATAPSRSGERARTDPVAPAHRVLVVGWNPFGAQVVTGWAALAGPEFVVEVVVEPAAADEVAAALGGIEHTVVPTSQSTSLVDRLERRDVEQQISTVVLLADESVGADESDARTLLRLALVKRLVPAEQRPRMLIELRDVDSLPLVEMPGPDDYVVSDAVGSRYIAQLAEQPDRRKVLLALYGENGASLKTERAGRLGVTGRLTAADVFATAAADGVIAIGWIAPAGARGELTLNPHPDAVVALEPDDLVVIVG